MLLTDNKTILSFWNLDLISKVRASQALNIKNSKIFMLTIQKIRS